MALALFVPLQLQPARNDSEEVMKFRTILSLASMFLVCFTIAVWSQPLPSEAASNKVPDTQSITGKISAIGDASFSLDVLKDQKVTTVQFLIDGNTKVDGKLTVGSKASVEYKSDSGTNIATHIVVATATTMNLY
jgi:hypothetical protein